MAINRALGNIKRVRDFLAGHSGEIAHEYDFAAFPDILKVQEAVAAMFEFRKTVRYVETLGFWPPESARNASRTPSFERWYDNTGSFLEMREAIGRAMLEIAD